jgi:hypothetical protein
MIAQFIYITSGVTTAAMIYYLFHTLSEVINLIP